jgi:hypothetical protein
MKFKGKPNELRAFLEELCQCYGKNQKIIAVYIIMDKEWEIKNDEI